MTASPPSKEKQETSVISNVPVRHCPNLYIENDLPTYCMLAVVIVFACVPMSVSSTELLGERVATDDAISRTQSIRLAVVGHGN